MPGIVMSQLLNNLANQMVGGQPPPEDNRDPNPAAVPSKAKRPPPEYAMANWFKKQHPNMTDQAAWEMGQRTLAMARSQPKNPNNSAEAMMHASAKQLALGLYLYHGAPDHYMEPTLSNLVGGPAPFGPQPTSSYQGRPMDLDITPGNDGDADNGLTYTSPLGAVSTAVPMPTMDKGY